MRAFFFLAKIFIMMHINKVFNLVILFVCLFYQFASLITFVNSINYRQMNGHILWNCLIVFNQHIILCSYYLRSYENCGTKTLSFCNFSYTLFYFSFHASLSAFQSISALVENSINVQIILGTAWSGLRWVFHLPSFNRHFPPLFERSFLIYIPAKRQPHRSQHILCRSNEAWIERKTTAMYTQSIL